MLVGGLIWAEQDCSGGSARELGGGGARLRRRGGSGGGLRAGLGLRAAQGRGKATGGVD